MTTLNEKPYLMNVIINIQNMKNVILEFYDFTKDFEVLKNLPESTLYEIQDNCIKEYNKKFKNL
jgi:hypothetical protein